MPDGGHERFHAEVGIRHVRGGHDCGPRPLLPCAHPGAQGALPSLSLAPRLPSSQPHCSDTLGRCASYQPQSETGRGPGRLCLGLSQTEAMTSTFMCHVPCRGARSRTSCSPLECHTGEPHLGTFCPGQPGTQDSRIVSENELPGIFQVSAATGPRWPLQALRGDGVCTEVSACWVRSLSPNVH